MNILDVIAILVFLSGLFIYINTFYLKLPSTVGLTILAMVLSLIVFIAGHLFPSLHLARHVASFDPSDILLRFVIPTMLFAQALNVDLKYVKGQIGLLAFISFAGVFISMTIIGTLVYVAALYINMPIGIIECGVFSALISTTDPISVTGTLKHYAIPRKLNRQMEVEALFNGGMAVTMAFLLISCASFMNELTFSTSGAMVMIIQQIIGGLVVGAIVGWVGYKVLDFVDNDDVEVEVIVTLALVLAGSYIAHLIGVSPVLVAILSGLALGNFGTSAHGEHAVGTYVYKFWQLIKESFAAILFVLVGFEMLMIPLRLDTLALGFIATNIVMLARWVAIYLPVKMVDADDVIDPATVPALAWGALRGGLPIALALSLNPQVFNKEIIVAMTYVVVVCTVLFQGLTLEGVLKEYHVKFISTAVKGKPVL